MKQVVVGSLLCLGLETFAGCGNASGTETAPSRDSIDNGGVAAPPDGGDSPDEAGAPVARGAPADWFKRTGGGYVYYLQESDKTFKAITADIHDHLGPAGYGFVLLYVPYSGDVDAFAGLGPVDFYGGGAAGSIDDVKALVAEAHAQNMAVWMWANLGYSVPSSPYYKKAVADHLAKVDSPESRAFAWIPNTETITQYWGYPGFDWGSQAWQDEAKKVTNFWLDVGMSGFVLDAWGQGVNQSAANMKALEDQVYARGNTLIIRESPDFEFDFDGNIVDALQNDTSIEALQPTRYTTAERLVEPSIDEDVDPTRYVLSPPALYVQLGIEMINVLTPMDDLNGYNVLTASQQREIDTMVGIVNKNRALNLDATKTRVGTNDQKACYVERRVAAESSQTVLAAFNFAKSAKTCAVDLGADGPAAASTKDLKTGQAGPAVASGKIAVALPAYGYAFLALTP